MKSLPLCLACLLVLSLPVETRASVEPTLTLYLPSNSPVSLVSAKSSLDGFWVKHLSLEFKNESSKPIYFLRLHLTFPR
jgi:hypothetical protein